MKNTMFLASIVIIGVLNIVLFLNPNDVLTKQSTNFSMSSFENVKQGDSIESVIDKLGEPLRVVELSETIKKHSYCFMGDYPKWVYGGTECWVICDGNGIVEEKYKVIEP